MAFMYCLPQDMPPWSWLCRRRAAIPENSSKSVSRPRAILSNPSSCSWSMCAPLFRFRTRYVSDGIIVQAVAWGKLPHCTHNLENKKTVPVRERELAPSYGSVMVTDSMICCSKVIRVGKPECPVRILPDITQREL